MGRAWGSTQARHLEGLTRLGFCKLDRLRLGSSWTPGSKFAGSTHHCTWPPGASRNSCIYQFFPYLYTNSIWKVFSESKKICSYYQESSRSTWIFICFTVFQRRQQHNKSFWNLYPIIVCLKFKKWMNKINTDDPNMQI